MMQNIFRKKKQSYLLLELLIAFFLLALFLTPLLGSPFSYLKKQRKAIHMLRLELEGEKHLAKIEEQLRTSEISWSQIAESANRPILLSTEEIRIKEAKKITRYESKLFLGKSKLQEEQDSAFAAVKAHIKIYEAGKKKPLIYQASNTLTVQRKNLMEPPALENRNAP
jgi:hypothetical protein